MFTLIHALQAYLVAAVFTKDSRLRLFSFVGGLLPDLDGITLLFNSELYYKYHREILHPPLVGLAVALAIIYLYEKKSAGRAGSAAFFTLGFFTHIIGDLVSTNWPINLIAPFGQLYVSVSPLLSYDVIYGTIARGLTIITLILFAALVIKERA